MPLTIPGMAATLEAAPPDAPSVDDQPRRHRGRVRPPEHRPMPADRAVSWIATALITILAATVRLWGIGFPQGKQFDEVYYATEGAEMLRNGYENNPGYMFIVHPPLGKWLVAAGIAVFGDNSIGWRVPSAIAGTLCVLILIRVARRMTRSTLLGCVAGILLAVDGLSIVQSRFALLDIFLALFVLAGFACLVVDRDLVRDRVRAGGPYGSRLGFRGWRLAGGILLGLSCGVKWSGVYFLAGFAVLSLLWDLGARRAAGVPRAWTGTALRDLPGAVGSLAVAPVAAYLLTWTGWFLGENPYDRHWADAHPTGYGSWLPGPIRSLLRYHAEMWDFHSGLSTPHTYQSSPWGWLVTGRPVLFYYPSNPSPTGCGASTCVRTVLDVGTPALWWAFAPAVLWAAWIALVRRDWRGWTVLVAFLAGWVTWFSVPGRTMFLFYMTPLVPFLVIGVTLILGAVLGPAMASEQRRTIGLVAVCGYVALVVINSAWLWPILTGQLITYQEWRSRIWFSSWI
jgi:dolichyl-phosphate-mannose-protein mannosyltransferase